MPSASSVRRDNPACVEARRQILFRTEKIAGTKPLGEQRLADFCDDLRG